MNKKHFLFLCLAAALVLAVGGCSGKKTPPYAMEESATLAVAPFSQPTSESEILAGYIPTDQHMADGQVLLSLDEALMNLINQRDSLRQVVGPGETNRCVEIQLRKGGPTRTNPLKQVLAVGECMSADYILVPQLINWQERQGGNYGAVETAKVHLNLYLVDVKNKRLAKRYYFEEDQAPLSDNLLNIGKFASRGGKFLSAQDLAVDGMKKGLEELGL